MHVPPLALQRSTQHFSRAAMFSRCHVAFSGCTYLFIRTSFGVCCACAVRAPCAQLIQPTERAIAIAFEAARRDSRDALCVREINGGASMSDRIL